MANGTTIYSHRSSATRRVELAVQVAVLRYTWDEVIGRVPYVVMEGNETLVDWGVRLVAGNKNADSLKKVDKMIADYQPSALVLQDAVAKGSRRGSRIRKLTKEIIALATNRKTKITLFARDQVMRAFFIDGNGTKHMVAQVLARRFPEELGHRFPGDAARPQALGHVLQGWCGCFAQFRQWFVGDPDIRFPNMD